MPRLLLAVLFLLLPCAPFTSPFLIPPEHRTPTRALKASYSSSAASPASFSGPDDVAANMDMLRASLHLLATHERQNAQDWEESLVDAIQQRMAANLMAQLCDTRLALLGGWVSCGGLFVGVGG